MSINHRVILINSIGQLATDNKNSLSEAVLASSEQYSY